MGKRKLTVQLKMHHPFGSHVSQPSMVHVSQLDCTGYDFQMLNLLGILEFLHVCFYKKFDCDQKYQAPTELH